MGKKRENRGKMNMPRSGEKSGIGGQGGEINRVENVENVEWGVRGRPMVGAAVPCRPHGFGRGDQENVERGFRQDCTGLGEMGHPGQLGHLGLSRMSRPSRSSRVASFAAGVLVGHGHPPLLISATNTVRAAGDCRPYPWDDTRSPKPNPVNPV